MVKILMHRLQTTKSMNFSPTKITILYGDKSVPTYLCYKMSSQVVLATLAFGLSHLHTCLEIVFGDFSLKKKMLAAH